MSADDATVEPQPTDASGALIEPPAHVEPAAAAPLTDDAPTDPLQVEAQEYADALVAAFGLSASNAWALAQANVVAPASDGDSPS